MFKSRTVLYLLCSFIGAGGFIDEVFVRYFCMGLQLLSKKPAGRSDHTN